MKKIIEEIQEHQRIVNDIFANLQSYIYTAKIILKEALHNDQKIFIFGNGIHALNANVFAYQLNDLKSMNAVSLTNDVGVLSAIANEYGFEKVFEKQIEIEAKNGDVLIGLSSSGCSKNVLRALSLGHNMGCKTIGLSGNNGGAMDEFCDVNIVIPSDNLERIQEMYNMIINIIFNKLMK